MAQTVSWLQVPIANTVIGSQQIRHIDSESSLASLVSLYEYSIVVDDDGAEPNESKFSAFEGPAICLK